MTDLVQGFKNAFRRHPAGVAIVAAESTDGRFGLTVSSVASVSVDPVALVFSVTKSSGSAGQIIGADSFVVHLLGEGQADVADAFARSGEPRFTPEQHWGTLPTGEPLLLDAPVALRSRALDTLTVGRSQLIVAEVLDVHEGPESGPLMYRDRQYFTLADSAAVTRP